MNPGIESLFFLLIFPGLLFSASVGILAGWVDRKVSARFQFRVGPPVLQNLNDILKLFGKETILPREGVPWLFVLAPVGSFAMLILVSAMVGMALFFGRGFGGDLIVVLYLLMLHSVMLFQGAASSGNVYASMGAGREIKLLIADELVFLLVCLTAVVKANFQLSLPAILTVQATGGALAGSLSGALALVLGVLCIQAKMALPPFHIAEAETELVEGPLMDYSGPLLGMWKLNQMVMYVVFPFLLILLFLGGFHLQGWGILWALLKYAAILVVMIIIKNTNPRLRIDTALAFFWKIAAPLALLALVLAILGV